MQMKVGIIGVGFVGTACAKAMLLRGSCHEIVLLDVKERLQHTRGVANDLSHGEPLCLPTRITAGDYDDLRDASVVVITAGINEKAGKAIDRQNQLGRLLLLPHNAAVYRQIVPQVVSAAPQAPIVVVTDPPDPLADIARDLAGPSHPILSTGTFLDTLRFRIQLARRLGCHANSVDAMVIGEHGTSQVYVWSSARVGGQLVSDVICQRGIDAAHFRAEVERAVKFANIDIIEGTDASQHGIGIVTARIVEAILRDERFVAPVAVWQPQFGVTLSLPSIIGRRGVAEVLSPSLSEGEELLLKASGAAIAQALKNLPQENA
jgi:L-lactate dehydrogenase